MKEGPKKTLTILTLAGLTNNHKVYNLLLSKVSLYNHKVYNLLLSKVSLYNHKIYDLLLSEISLYYVYILSREELSVLVYLLSLVR